MTKMLTCIAALQLYEKGKHKLDDPISKYLSEFERMRITSNALDTQSSAKIASGISIGDKSNYTESGYAKNPITVIDLFTMSAGLDYDLSAEKIKKALQDGKTSTRDLVGAMSKTILGFEPGTRFRYSLCHGVLGALIEVWSGKRLGIYMEENIFKPLGMKNTFFGLPEDEDRLSKMAAIYKPKRAPLKCGFNLSDNYESGGAGLCSCTEDYALFLDALACGRANAAGNRILTAETVKLMGTDHLSGQRSVDFDLMRSGYGYGLGVRVHKDNAKSGSLSPIGEFGWDGTAGSFSMVDPVNKVSITYFNIYMHGIQKCTRVYEMHYIPNLTVRRIVVDVLFYSQTVEGILHIQTRWFRHLKHGNAYIKSLSKLPFREAPVASTKGTSLLLSYNSTFCERNLSLKSQKDFKVDM